jgi:hypothetical protein
VTVRLATVLLVACIVFDVGTPLLHGSFVLEATGIGEAGALDARSRVAPDAAGENVAPRSPEPLARVAATVRAVLSRPSRPPSPDRPRHLPAKTPAPTSSDSTAH